MYIIKRFILINAFILFVFLSINKPVSYALNPSPIISSMCTTEASVATSLLNVGIPMGFFGTMPPLYALGGNVSVIFQPFISPTVKIIFCDGDAINASFLNSQKYNSKYTTTKIEALDTRLNKTFSEQQLLDASEKEGANTLPVQSADNVYRAVNTSNGFVTATEDYIYLNSIFQKYDNSAVPIIQSEARTNLQTARSLNSVNVFGVDDYAAGGVIGGNKDAYNYVLNITDPYPLQPIPISKFRGPQGAEILAARNMQKSQILLAQEIFSNIISLHAPVQKQTAWHQGVESQTGIQPVVVSSKNVAMASVMSTLAHDVQSKFNNPIYTQAIGTNITKRRVAQIWGAEQPLGLELNYYNMLFAQQMSAAYAEILAKMASNKSINKTISTMSPLK